MSVRLPALLVALWLALLSVAPAEATPTLIDSDRVGDNSGTPQTSVALPPVTGQAGDGYACHAKWEGANGSTVTVSADVTTSDTGATLTTDHTNNDLHERMFYGQIDSGSAATFTLNLSPARAFIVFHCYVFRPAGGTELVFDASPTPTQGAAGTNPATGSQANAAAGAAVAGFSYYSSIDPAGTTAGSGWNEEVFAVTESAGSLYRLLTGSGTITADINLGVQTADWIANMVILKEQSGVTLELEGFRFGVDDGNEASHTFEAAQDTNISIADNQSRLLRTLVNATGDPASAAYTLRYQKNGSGGYVAVPVGSTTPGSISNQTVAASSDDAQEVGGTVTLTGTTIGASLDATTEWVGMRFPNITIPAGATITSAAVGVVPSATTEDEPLVTVFLEAADNCATFTTAASSISGRSRTTGVSWSSTDLAATGASYHDTPSLVSDVQAVINRGGWASGNALCVLIQGGATGTRDLTIEAQDLGPNTNPPRLSVAWTVPNQVYITTSANIAAGGEATTARLTAPSGKSTSDFVTGRRWDDENGTDTIDITTDDYTEVEWLVFIASSAADGDFFDFRTYAGAAALDTYTLTPRWTIPVPGGGSIIPKVMHNRRQRTLH